MRRFVVMWLKKTRYFYLKNKKDVEKFYTRCRDVLHNSINFEFFKIIFGKPIRGGSPRHLTY
jgi:hypothetical protein